jgi:hypothetical protein
MLAHDIKNILNILPDAQPLVKEANLEVDYPLDTKDGAIASYLRYQYRTKVAHKLDGLSPETIEQIEKAAELYGIKDQVKPLVTRLEKYAQTSTQAAFTKYAEMNVKTAEFDFEGKASGFSKIPELVKEAQELCNKYGEDITSFEVLRYAGKGFFNKQAAVQALFARAQASGKEVFTKVAEIVEKSMSESSTEREVSDVLSRINQLDDKTGLSLRGFNIYKEAMLPKEAAASILNVRVCGKQVPYEKIAMLGKERIRTYIGEDVAEGMSSDPVANKQMIEALPLSEQRLLESMLKNV